MISSNRYRSQFLDSLERHRIESSPKNYMKVMCVLESRWDLSPDELVQVAFSVRKIYEPDFKFEISLRRSKKIIHIRIYIFFVRQYTFYIHI